jgi:hypothetical protein
LKILEFETSIAGFKILKNRAHSSLHQEKPPNVVCVGVKTKTGGSLKKEEPAHTGLFLDFDNHPTLVDSMLTLLPTPSA